MSWRGDLFGCAGLTLVAIGSATLWGWPAACLAIGIPLSAFYLWGQAQRMANRRGGE